MDTGKRKRAENPHCIDTYAQCIPIGITNRMDIVVSTRMRCVCHPLVLPGGYDKLLLGSPSKILYNNAVKARKRYRFQLV